MNWPFSQLKRNVSLPSGSLSMWQLIDIALKNLFYKKLRTSLTIGGVIIGVGAVFFLLSFGFGLRDVVSRQVVDSNSVRTVDVSPAKANLVTLNDENIKRIERTAGVESVAPVYYNAGKVNYNNAKIQAVVYGASQKYLDLSSFTRLEGSLPNFKQPTSKSIFVSSGYIKAIGVKKPRDVIGKSVEVTIETQLQRDGEITKKTIEYSGVVQGVIDNGSGSEMYVPANVFTNAGVDTASQLKVLVNNKSDVATVQKKVEALGFSSTSPLQTLEQINQIFGILNILFLGFGGIGLLIATLGMFNTLTISLLERTKEIGLMVALGARRRDVKRLFIVEAVGLALIGGILGIVGAAILSTAINTVLNQLSKSRGVTDAFTIFSFPWWLLLATVGFSIILGLIVVYIPARRAARINPIEALKSS